MNRPCSNKINCSGGGTDSDDPIFNWSSEQFDGPDFPSLAWFIGNANNPFFVETPIGGFLADCDSPISQADADQCAVNTVIIHNTPTPPGGPPPTFFFSSPQSCNYICPDGSVYTFTTPAGWVVSASNQATADAQAHAYACQQAASTHTCLTTLSLSTITPGACVNTFFSQVITISGGRAPYNAAFTGGSFPNGISASEPSPNHIRIAGTPTEIGIFPFQLTVTDSSGQSAVRNYEIDVLGITNPDLPDYTANTPYSEQFMAGGGTPPFTFQLLTGSLPTGFTLASDGIVSGTSADTGSFDFTVGITDASGNVCEQDCTIATSSCPVDWTQLVWDTASFFHFGNGSATGSASQNTFSFNLAGDNQFPAGGADSGADFHSSMLYTGGAGTCQIDINIFTIVGRGQMAFNILQDGVSVLGVTYNPALAINPLGLVPGHNIITFNIAAGVNSVLEVAHGAFPLARASGNAGPIPPGQIGVSFTLG